MGDLVPALLGDGVVIVEEAFDNVKANCIEQVPAISDSIVDDMSLS